jgi:hypothetical protein
LSAAGQKAAQTKKGKAAGRKAAETKKLKQEAIIAAPPNPQELTPQQPTPQESTPSGDATGKPPTL